MVVAQPVGQGVQAVGGAGDQDEVVTAGGEPAGELDAEAGGRAGDEGGGAVGHGISND